MEEPNADTSNPETQEENNNAIFENDSPEALEEKLLSQFTKQEEPATEDETKEPEATEQEEEETEEETEEVESDGETEDKSSDESEDDLSEKQQAAFDKRISRALKKHQAEHDEKMQELENAKAEAESPTDALSKVKSTMNHGVLEKIVDDAENTIDFVDEHPDPDGVIIHEGTKDEKILERKDLLEMRKNARSVIREAKSRKKLIDQTNSFNSEVHKSYPSLLDKGSDETQAVNQIFNEIPALKENPKGLLTAIELILGRQALAAQAQEKAKPKKKKASPTAPKLPDSQPTPKKSASSQKRVNADLLAVDGGDVDALVDAYLSK